MAKIVVVTSGKGGVGKTTTSAAFASGLALAGHKTAVIDFDVGLRNLDLIMGCGTSELQRYRRSKKSFSPSSRTWAGLPTMSVGMATSVVR